MKWYAILAACLIVGASGESLFELFSHLYYGEDVIFNVLVNLLNLFIISFGLFVPNVNQVFKTFYTWIGTF